MVKVIFAGIGGNSFFILFALGAALAIIYVLFGRWHFFGDNASCLIGFGYETLLAFFVSSGRGVARVKTDFSAAALS